MTENELGRGEGIAKDWMDVIYEARGYAVDRGEGGRGWIPYDVILTRRDATHFKVEEKFRRPDRNNNDYPDVAVELMDGAGEEVLYPGRSRSMRHDGWLFYCEADWVSYVFCDDEWLPHRCLWLKWPAFRNWLWRWLRERRRFGIVSDIGKKGLALNVVVPVKELPAEITHEMLVAPHELPWDV